MLIILFVCFRLGVGAGLAFDYTFMSAQGDKDVVKDEDGAVTEEVPILLSRICWGAGPVAGAGINFLYGYHGKKEFILLIYAFGIKS